MKTLNEFLTEREVKGNKIEYSKEKTKKLLILIGEYGNKTFTVDEAINFLEEGAEPTALVLERLVGCLIPTSFMNSEAKMILLYIKDNYDISNTLNEVSSLTIPQALFGGNNVPISSLEWCVENGFINKANINLKNNLGDTLLGFVVTSGTRTSPNIEAIDILLKVGADINDSSFGLNDISSKAIKEYLIKKGRTQE